MLGRSAASGVEMEEEEEEGRSSFHVYFGSLFLLSLLPLMGIRTITCCAESKVKW